MATLCNNFTANMRELFLGPKKVIFGFQFQVHQSYLGHHSQLLHNESVGTLSPLPHVGDPGHSGQQPGSPSDSNSEVRHWTLQTFWYLFVSGYKQCYQDSNINATLDLSLLMSEEYLASVSSIKTNLSSWGGGRRWDAARNWDDIWRLLHVLICCCSAILMFPWQKGDILVSPEDQEDPTFLNAPLADPNRLWPSGIVAYKFWRTFPQGNLLFSFPT